MNRGREIAPGGSRGSESRGEAYTALGFGVFLHYGLATFVGRTPWSYDPHEVAPTVYDPPAFDAGQWMDAVAASGARYIVLTTKHHDGFTMWPSEHTDYGVHTSSDSDVDVVGDVVRAARDRGLRVGLYYSWYDKLHPGGDVQAGSPTAEYVAYAQDHLRELLSEYGPVIGLWLDTPLYAREVGVAEFVHRVSPETAFIWKNTVAGRSLGEYPAADVLTFEGPEPDIIPSDYTGMPAEQAYNVAGGPGWWETTPKAIPRGDVEESVSMLARTRKVGATLTLNISPGPTGQFSAANVRLLERIGARLRA